MDKRGRTILIIVMLAAFVGVVVIEFVSMKNGNQSPIRSAVKGMLDAPEPAPDTPPADATPKREPAPKDRRQPPPPSVSTSPSMSPAPAGTLLPLPPPAAQLPAPVVVVPKPQPPPLSNVAPAPVFAVQQRRSDTFVPGNLRGWIGYGVTFDHPLLVRAGGELRAADQVSGPNGLKDSGEPREPAGARRSIRACASSRGRRIWRSSDVCARSRNAQRRS